MRLFFVAVIAFLVVGCSENYSGEFKMSVVEVSREELYQVAGHPVNAYAEWAYTDNDKECTIYIMPIDEYPSLREYHRVLGHELDHCIRLDYHAPGATHEEIYGPTDKIFMLNYEN
jgi:hypothetical protein